MKGVLDFDDEALLAGWSTLVGCHRATVAEQWGSRTARLAKLDTGQGDRGFVLARSPEHISSNDIEALFELTGRLYAEMRARSGSVKIPQPLALDSDRKVVFSEFIDGEDVGSAIVHATANGDRDTAREVVRRAAEAIAVFHSVGIAICSVSSGPGAENAASRRPRWMPRMNSRGGLAFRYGDCSPSNMLDFDGSVYLIDLPIRLRLGPISADLASFIFHFRRLLGDSLRSSQAETDSLVDEFLAAYSRTSRTPLTAIRREAFVAEARRALNMARKRWGARRFGSSLRYLLWSLQAFAGRHAHARPVWH